MSEPIYTEKDVTKILHDETERQIGLVEKYQTSMHEELEKVTAEYQRIAKRAFYLGLFCGVAGCACIYAWYQLFFA